MFYNTLLPEFYKGHWDKYHGSVSVTAFKSAYFWKGKGSGSSWNYKQSGEKKLDFIESNNTNSAAAGRFIPPDYTPKRNDLYCISSVERVVVEVKDSVETNIEISKNELVQMMDGGDKLH